MKILKFGGTSVKDAAAMKQIKEIISDETTPILIVLSACSGITNKLQKIAFLAKENQDYQTLIKDVADHHLKLVRELIDHSEQKEEAINHIYHLIEELNDICEGVSLLEELSVNAESKILSFGELLSTFIFYKYVSLFKDKSILVDSRDYLTLKSDNYKKLFDIKDVDKTRLLELNNLLTKSGLVIAQGFIASNEFGETTNLGRGGSDYTASIFGAILSADAIEIWTDVDGIMSADPRIVEDVFSHEELSYNDVRLMSFFGAKVLHVNAIRPAIEKNIDVIVKNTKRPEFKGSWIKREVSNTNNGFKTIIEKKEIRRISIEVNEKNNTEEEHKNLQKLFLEQEINVIYSEIINNYLVYYLEEKKSLQFIEEKINSKEKYTLIGISLEMIILIGVNINCNVDNILQLVGKENLVDMKLNLVKGFLILAYKKRTKSSISQDLHTLLNTG